VEESENKPAPARSAPEPDDNDSNRPFLVLLFALVLAAFGWWLISRLSEADRMQDCVMSGRHNCAPVDVDSVK